MKTLHGSALFSLNTSKSICCYTFLLQDSNASYKVCHGAHCLKNQSAIIKHQAKLLKGAALCIFQAHNAFIPHN